MARQLITPCLWFDGCAEEAAAFYVSLFPSSSIVSTVRFGEADAVVTVSFDLAGFRVTGLNGGPQFRFTPAISFFVMCETTEDVDRVWGALSADGKPVIPLGTYPWSERYGWTADRFGMTWQVMLAPGSAAGQTIVPCQLFVGDAFGLAEAAMSLYTSIFPEAAVCAIERYVAGEPGREGTVKHARFTLAGGTFTVMDGPGDHAYGFNEAVSFVITCETQAEIDRYWSALTANGGSESMCGWLKDPFGVSWQVVPADLPALLGGPNGAAAGRALMTMRKLDVATLRAAR